MRQEKGAWPGLRNVFRGGGINLNAVFIGLFPLRIVMAVAQDDCIKRNKRDCNEHVAWVYR